MFLAVGIKIIWAFWKKTKHNSQKQPPADLFRRGLPISPYLFLPLWGG